MNEDLTNGEQIAETLFGAERFARTRTDAPESHRRDLLRLADEVVFGKTYSREGLELAERSLCTIAALTVLSQPAQLRAHIGAALNIGVPPRKITEVIRQMAFYGGFPAALNAMEIADQCISESAGEAASTA